MPIEIMNLRVDKQQYIYDVLCDRRTILGNPFGLREGQKERDKVCDNYQEYFEKKMKENGNTQFKRKIRSLIEIYKNNGNLRLFCWCSPQRCHTETIKKYILDRC